MMRFLWTLLALSLFSATAFAEPGATPIVCNQEYALCTSAQCVPDPRHADMAICSCVVENGNSVGYKSCNERTPKSKQFKVKRLISTFSFKQFATKKGMSCPRGKPWTNCLDAPCNVDPLRAGKAICSCKINHDQDFITFGGGCDSSQCATGFWSGATLRTSNALRKAMLENINVTQDPWPSVACPVDKQ